MNPDYFDKLFEFSKNDISKKNNKNMSDAIQGSLMYIHDYTILYLFICSFFIENFSFTCGDFDFCWLYFIKLI